VSKEFNEEQEFEIVLLIRREMKRIMDTGFMHTELIRQQPKPKVEDKPQPPTTERQPNIADEFKPEIRRRLTFENQGGSWKVTANGFLEKDVFREVCGTVERLFGEYVRAGKASHWTVPVSGR
jgi:hypothetical protein